MCLTEFDQDAYMEMIREETREETHTQTVNEFNNAMKMYLSGERNLGFIH